MKRRAGTAHMVEAAPLIAADETLTAQDAQLAADGYTRKEKARAYLCRDGSLSLQFVWTRKHEGRTGSYTISLKRQR